MHNNFLMGVKFWTSWGSPKNFLKSHYSGDFLKNGLKSIFLEKIVKRFLCKKWGKFFIGDSFFKITLLRWLFEKWSQKYFFGKWPTFGPLNFFIFGYVKGGVRGNNKIGIKKCTTNFLWVLNLGQVGCHRKFF